jgi:membrane-bound metal-dependent hydrolase YbcI (DUF457 family)
LILGATLLGSVIPDFDFLPGILIGDPGAFHHGVSHSLGFAVLFGTAVFFVLRYFRRGDSVARAAIVAALAYTFHSVLDAVSVNEGAKAVPLLWPLSQENFGINLGLFGHFYHDGFASGPWSVVRRENVPAVARELIVLGIPSLLIHFWTIKSANTRSPQKTAVEAANE